MKTRLSLVVSIAAASMMSVTGTALAEQHFHATETGTLTGAEVGGKAGEQDLTTGPGTVVVCKVTNIFGTIEAVEMTEQKVDVDYSTCEDTELGLGATVSEGHYDLRADERISIEEPITITVTGVCVVTVEKQELQGLEVSYINMTSGGDEGLEVVGHMSGIRSEVTSGSKLLCKGGNEGTYIGDNFVHSASTNRLTWSNP